MIKCFQLRDKNSNGLSACSMVEERSVVTDYSSIKLQFLESSKFFVKNKYIYYHLTFNDHC